MILSNAIVCFALRNTECLAGFPGFFKFFNRLHLDFFEVSHVDRIHVVLSCFAVNEAQATQLAGKVLSFVTFHVTGEVVWIRERSIAQGATMTCLPMTCLPMLPTWWYCSLRTQHDGNLGVGTVRLRRRFDVRRWQCRFGGAFAFSPSQR